VKQRHRGIRTDPRSHGCEYDVDPIRVYEITANEESRYQTLLHVAAATRRRPETAAVNITYTASVTAVAAITPSATKGCMGAGCSNTSFFQRAPARPSISGFRIRDSVIACYTSSLFGSLIGEWPASSLANR